MCDKFDEFRMTGGSDVLSDDDDEAAPDAC